MHPADSVLLRDTTLLLIEKRQTSLPSLHCPYSVEHSRFEKPSMCSLEKLTPCVLCVPLRFKNTKFYRRGRKGTQGKNLIELTFSTEGKVAVIKCA